MREPPHPSASPRRVLPLVVPLQPRPPPSNCHATHPTADKAYPQLLPARPTLGDPRKTRPRFLARFSFLFPHPEYRTQQPHSRRGELLLAPHYRWDPRPSGELILPSLVS